MAGWENLLSVWNVAKIYPMIVFCGQIEFFVTGVPHTKPS